MSLLDEIDEALGDVADRLGASTGAEPDDAASAVDAVVPVLIGGMADRAEASGGADRLLGLLQGLESGSGSGAAGRNGDDSSEPSADLDGQDGVAGRRLVDGLFGAERDELVTGLSSRSGLREPLIEQTLVSVAPTVATVVDERRRGDDLDADGLAELLSVERAELVEAGRLRTIDAMLEHGAARAAGVMSPILIVDADSAPDPALADADSEDEDLQSQTAMAADPDDDQVVVDEAVADGGGRVAWLWWGVAALAGVILLSVFLAARGGDETVGEATTSTSTSTSTSTTTAGSTMTSTTPTTAAPSTSAATSTTSTTTDPDADLAAAVDGALAGQVGVSAEIDDGTVTLEGVVADEEAGIALAERIATLPGVELVVNGLVVEPPSDVEDDSSGDTLNERLDLDPVTFAYLSTVITPEGEQVLDRAARYLIDNPELRIEIGGHTDSDGPAADNQRLSELRASEVRAFLAARGVDADRLEVNGYGETEPTVPNDTPENKAINRRIEFTIL